MPDRYTVRLFASSQLLESRYVYPCFELLKATYDGRWLNSKYWVTRVMDVSARKAHLYYLGRQFVINKRFCRLRDWEAVDDAKAEQYKEEYESFRMEWRLANVR